MELLESVDPSEVPEGASRSARPGLWTGLARRAINDCDQGKVTVVVFKDEAEYKKMRNGISDYLRKAGYRPTPTVVTNANGTLRVFLQLERKVEVINNNHPRRPAASGIRPVRRH